jgi:hypothetical protein
VFGHDPGRYEGFEGKVHGISFGLSVQFSRISMGFKCRFIRISGLKNLILRDCNEDLRI